MSETELIPNEHPVFDMDVSPDRPPKARASTSKGKMPFSCSDWDLNEILSSSPNFISVTRISAAEEYISEMISRYEAHGQPLVISDLHKVKGWNRNLLDPRWLVENCGDTSELVSF